MSTYTFPTAAALRADALADFRVEVERLSQAIDWERVTYRRARCERFNHVLGGPELHYRKHTGDRGRWFIECGHDHPGDVQGGGSLFEFVSQPLVKDELLYLRDLKAAGKATVNDILDARRRAADMRTRRISAVTANAYKVRSTYRSVVPMAPWKSRRVPGRSRSPSLEVLESAPARTFDIYFFYKKESAPYRIRLPIIHQTATLRLRNYDSYLEEVGVKISDFIHLLVLSDTDGASPFWTCVRACELSVPVSSGPLVASCDGALPAPSHLRRLYQHACDVASINL